VNSETLRVPRQLTCHYILAVFYAQALYDYEAANPDDLALSAGQLIQVVPSTEPNSAWWFGRKVDGPNAGAEGWFPASYVMRVENAAAGIAASAPAASGVGAVVRGYMMYDFVGQDSDELTVSAGTPLEILDQSDPGWWQVRANGQEGVVPASYVRIG
jgi:hypothetical protein